MFSDLQKVKVEKKYKRPKKKERSKMMVTKKKRDGELVKEELRAENK